MYSAEEMKRSLSKARAVAFNEIIDVNGLLNVTAIKSGYSIGTCNWLITTDYHKAIDLAPMMSPDVVIVSCISQFPHRHPDETLTEFAKIIEKVLRSGGNVLVPCSPTGLIYDLIEFLSITLANDGLSKTSMYCVSSVVDTCFAFANIYPECLVESKEQKVFVPEEPFLHGSLNKNGDLKYYTSLHERLHSEFEPPAVVFASHPSLRMGDSVHFMEFFNTDPKNAVVIVGNFAETFDDFDYCVTSRTKFLR
ncbi:unnamed protein product [Soboliphyme baturini]|uniref:Beta-Casp domain-containing protein n=1 Tax=Soboliphyme baturini TaxID=241478 RepID=A0A183IZ97_9BILA|nr:unnamed protein product [Soboliphyme baturini]